MSKSPRDTKGPVVKTGPTRGENRSRNKDGRWRAKRDDAGKSRNKRGKSNNKKGCFLTTAACEYRGLPDDCHELRVLRQLRDNVLLKTLDGAALVNEYYLIAPALVPLLEDDDVAKKVWQDILIAVERSEQGHYEAAIRIYREMVEALSLLLAKNNAS